MKNIYAILFGVCAVFCAQSGLAGQKDSGLYADVGAGYGKVNVESPWVHLHNRGFLGTANLGYQFTPHLALEGGATLYPKVLNTTNYNAHVAIKGIVSVSDKVDLFGKVGAAYVHSINTNVSTSHRIAPYVGAGATYWINDNLGATLQGEATAKREHAVPAMFGATMGLSYKFN